MPLPPNQSVQLGAVCGSGIRRRSPIKSRKESSRFRTSLEVFESRPNCRYVYGLRIGRVVQIIVASRDSKTTPLPSRGIRGSIEHLIRIEIVVVPQKSITDSFDQPFPFGEVRALGRRQHVLRVEVCALRIGVVRAVLLAVSGISKWYWGKPREPSAQFAFLFIDFQGDELFDLFIGCRDRA